MSRSHAQDEHQHQTENRIPPRDPANGWHGGLTREVARVEMDRFRGVAEYETRKLLGQHGALKEPVRDAPQEVAKRPQQKKAER